MSNVRFSIIAALCLVLCPGAFAAEPGDDINAVALATPEVFAASEAESDFRSALEEVVQAVKVGSVFANFQEAKTEYLTDPDGEVALMGLDAYFDENIAPLLETQGVSSAARVGIKSLFKSWVEAEVEVHTTSTSRTRMGEE